MADAIAAEMQGIVRGASEPWRPGDSVKAQIDRASRRLGLKYRRARTFWYGETAAIRAHEADRLRAAERKLLADRLAALRIEHDEITARLNVRERKAGNATDSAENCAGGGVVQRDVGGDCPLVRAKGIAGSGEVR